MTDVGDGFTLSGEEYAQLLEMAKTDYRSVADEVRWLVAQEVRRRALVSDQRVWAGPWVPSRPGPGGMIGPGGGTGLPGVIGQATARLT